MLARQACIRFHPQNMKGDYHADEARYDDCSENVSQRVKDCRMDRTHIRLNARSISRTEYRSTTGRPCGQLIGYSVFASSLSSHSIFV